MSSDSRYTSEMSDVERYLEGILLTFICLVAVVGNASLWMVVLTTRSLYTESNYLLLSLSSADLLVSLVSMPVTVVTIFRSRWVFSLATCKAIAFINMLTLVCSVMSLGLISINRYIKICRPHVYRRAYTHRNIFLMTVGVWLLSALLASPPLIGWSVYDYLPRQSFCFCNWATSVSYTFFMVGACFGGPLLMMSFSNFRILQTFKKSKRRVQPQQQQRQQQHGKAEKPTQQTQVINKAMSLNVNPKQNGHVDGKSDAKDDKKDEVEDGDVSIVVSNTNAAEMNGPKPANFDSSTKDSESHSPLDIGEKYTKNTSLQNGIACEGSQPMTISTPVNVGSSEGELKTDTSGDKSDADQRVSEATSAGEANGYLPSNTLQVPKTSQDIRSKAVSESSKDNTLKTSKSPITFILPADSKAAQEEESSDTCNKVTVEVSQTRNGNHIGNGNTAENGNSSGNGKQSGKTIVSQSESSIVRAMREQKREKRRNEEVQLVLSLVVVIFVFVLCWLPFCITMFLSVFAPHTLTRAADIFTLMLGYSNSCFNPIIYGIMNKNVQEGYRKLLRRMLSCCWCVSRSHGSASAVSVVDTPPSNTTATKHDPPKR